MIKDFIDSLIDSLSFVKILHLIITYLGVDIKYINTKYCNNLQTEDELSNYKSKIICYLQTFLNFQLRDH